MEIPTQALLGPAYTAQAHDIVCAMTGDTAGTMPMASEGIIWQTPLRLSGELFTLWVTRARLLYIVAANRPAAEEIARQHVKAQNIGPSHHVPVPNASTPTLRPRYPRLNRITTTREEETLLLGDELLMPCPDAVEAYIEAGTTCPQCGDTALSSEHPRAEGPTKIVCHTRCHGCGASWDDVHFLTNIEAFAPGGES